MSKYRYLKSIVLPLTIAALVIVFVLLVISRFRAASVGESIGTEYGSISGKAVGSLEGITVGQTAGYEAGKEKGLLAEDTEASLSESIRATGKLQVLVASGTFSDILSIGGNVEEAKDFDYAALLSMKYNAVFSVDLMDITVSMKEDGLHVWLKQPQVEFIPVGEVSVVNEYKKNPHLGSTEDGYDAFNNSTKQMKEKATRKLAEDPALMSAAREAAVSQLTHLVNAVSVSKPKVHVYFND